MSMYSVITTFFRFFYTDWHLICILAFCIQKFVHRFIIRLAFLLRTSYGKNNQKFKRSEPSKNLTRAKAKLALEILGSQAMNFFVFVVRCSCKMLICFLCLFQTQATLLLTFQENKKHQAHLKRFAQCYFLHIFVCILEKFCHISYYY